MTKRFMVRNSGRSDFTTCRWKYWVGYVDRLKPNDIGGMNALIFGDIVHRCLSAWYIPETSRRKVVRGVHPAVTADKIFDKLEEQSRRTKIKIVDPNEEEFEEARDLAKSMLNNYISAYGNDDQYMVIYPEMPFQLDVYDDDGNYLFTLVGTTDGLVRQRSDGAWGMLEHKTAAQISTDHLILDEQANTYWTFVPMWLWENGILPEDVDIEFMDYNFLRKNKLDLDGPQNSDGLYVKDPTIAQMTAALKEAKVEFSKTGMKKQDYKDLCEESGLDWVMLGDPKGVQLSDLFYRERVTRNETQRVNAYNRTISQVLEMKRLETGEIDLYKMPGKHCTWCQYQDICHMDERGAPIDDLITYGYHRWNPFRDHIWSLDLSA